MRVAKGTKFREDLSALIGDRTVRKRILVAVGIIVLIVGTFLSYPTTKMIMAGDRIMQQYPPGYLGLTMSNKSWLLALTLAVIGGCVGHLLYTLWRRYVRLPKKKISWPIN